MSSRPLLRGLGSRLLGCARPGRTRGRQYHQVPTAGAGYRAANEQQLALGVDAHDLEILNGAVRRAVMTRHLLSREHTAGILRHADRTWLVVRNRVAVARAVRGEVVALDHASESLTERHAAHVDFLSDLENVGA